MSLLTRECINQESDEVVQRYLDELLDGSNTWFDKTTQSSLTPEHMAREEISAVLKEIIPSQATSARETYEIISGRLFSLKSTKPFLLFEDAGVLIQRWCQARGKPYPNRAFFDQITADLYRVVKHYFPDAFLLRTKDFLRGMADLRQRTKTLRDWPTITISLDTDLITDTDTGIEVTRVKDYQTFEPLGTIARPREPSVKEQVRRIALALPPRHTVQLITDVCWSAAEVEKLDTLFLKAGVRIDGVLTGLAKRKAVEVCYHSQIPLAYHFPYPGLEALICQRDLLPGVPRSGLNLGIRTKKTARALPEDVGAPYLLPFREDIFTELSPRERTVFALECYRITDRLFAQVEWCWGRAVLTSDLARVPKYMTIGPVRFRSELRRIAIQFLGTDIH